MVKNNENIIAFALVCQEIKPQIESDPNTFFKFVDEYLKICKPTENQIEASKNTISTLLSRLEGFKVSGEAALKPIVGLVEGVFDMLHFGHFNAIRQASLCCDELIIGVNCDTSVQIHKG